MILNKYFYKLISKEIESFARFYSKSIFIKNKFQNDNLYFYSKINNKLQIDIPTDIHKLNGDEIIILNGHLNYLDNIQYFLSQIHGHLQRTNRVSIVLYNSYFVYLYKIANFFKLRKNLVPSIFLTKLNLHNLCNLSNFEVVRIRNSIYFPFYIPFISNLINLIFPIFPLIKNFSFTTLVILRPIKIQQIPPSLSILIPARNEKGNIKNCINRLPKFETNSVEIIFIEGNSTDGTWEEINHCIETYNGPYKLKAIKQDGKGKKNAVNIGLLHCKNELITILDADLTMPPENLPQFYNAYYQGKADFINGNRLFYPMENEAMKPLNLLGNIFFAKALSFVLAVDLADTLCGTKFFNFTHYQIIKKWNEEFGDFDPFGDFEFLFPASITGIGLINLPIKYRNRQYGETNIQRFRDGFYLLKMTIVGLKTRLGKTSYL